MKAKIKIDIVSDVVCPWCYIGKRRLEKAIKAVENDFEFELQYHPFELNPGSDLQGVDLRQNLVEKFGGEERYEAIIRNVSSLAAREGLEFNLDKQTVLPNTRKAHALIQYAASLGNQEQLVENLFRAYFTDAIDLSRDENLIDLAVKSGLETEQVRQTIADPVALKNVENLEDEFYKLGVNGVPFYIINNKYAISGAQTSETFIKAFETLWEEMVIEGETVGEVVKKG